jgi:hypothetical protein
MIKTTHSALMALLLAGAAMPAAAQSMQPPHGPRRTRRGR